MLEMSRRERGSRGCEECYSLLKGLGHLRQNCNTLSVLNHSWPAMEIGKLRFGCSANRRVLTPIVSIIHCVK